MSDRASKAHAEASLPGEPRTYDARSRQSGVPLTTLYYRDHGRRSKEEKAQSQQYLTPSEEKALERYLKQMADLGNPVRIKHLPSLAFSTARRRSTTNNACKPPNNEDIVEARATRAAKNALKGKGKRGRKRKTAPVELGELEAESEAEPEVAHTAKVLSGNKKRGRKRESATQAVYDEEPELLSEPEVAQTTESQKIGLLEEMDFKVGSLCWPRAGVMRFRLIS